MQNVSEKQRAMAKAYEVGETTGGVWLRARGREVRVRDGRGFAMPSKLVGRVPRWFKHLDEVQFEGDKDVAVVKWPTPGAKDSKHEATWCDVKIEEFRPPPESAPPRTATEVEIARQRDEAVRAATAAGERATALEAELMEAQEETARIADVVTSQDGQINDLMDLVKDLRTQLSVVREDVAPKASASPSDARPEKGKK